MLMFMKIQTKQKHVLPTKDSLGKTASNAWLTDRRPGGLCVQGRRAKWNKLTENSITMQQKEKPMRADKYEEACYVLA
jgi:hypothetical protein